MVDNEAVRFLVAEGVYPANVRRFADLPGVIVQAAADSTGLPSGHVHRAGRLVERLEAYRAGLWQASSIVSIGTSERVDSSTGERATASEAQAACIARRRQNHDTGQASASSSDWELLWTSVLDEMACSVPEREFDTWLRRTRLLDLDDARAVIGTGNVFTRESVAAAFGEQLAAIVSDRLGRAIAVEVVIC